MNPLPGRQTSQAPPWWSAADQAELDVLVDAFVEAAFVHRERCAACSASGPWCLPLREALEGVLSWRRSRELRSKAAWLRARQEFADREAAAA